MPAFMSMRDRFDDLTDFTVFRPATYSGQSTPKASLPHISSERPWVVPDLDVTLTRLMDALWSASQKKSGPQPAPMMGARRPAAAEPAYQRLVAPTTSPGADLALQMNPNNVGKVIHLEGAVPDWGLHKSLSRVTGFTFRGDTRAPTVIRTADGFQPPSTRTDDQYIDDVIVPQFAGYLQRRFGRTLPNNVIGGIVRGNPNMQGAGLNDMIIYSTWRAILKQEELHAGRMVAEQALKGYISTSKSVGVAGVFAGLDGTVYVVLLRGAWELPPKGSMPWTHLFAEHEVCSPFPVPWRDVCGWRDKRNGRLTGEIRLRTSMLDQEPRALQQVYELLSGKPQ